MTEFDGDVIIHMLHETARAIQRLAHVSQHAVGMQTDETIACMLLITLRSVLSIVPASTFAPFECELALAFIHEAIGDRHAEHTRPATIATIRAATIIR